MKILFTGGGTGGHIIPIIAIARELRKIYSKSDLKLCYLGPKDDFGAILLLQEGIKVKHVFSGKIRRYYSASSILQNVVDVLFYIPLGIIQSFFYIFFLSPDLILSKGGFGSIPGVAAAKLLFAPIFLHESDAAPGLASKIISKFALEVFVSFPKTEYFSLKKMITVGNPVRKELFLASKEEAKEFFEIRSQKPVILILGGSQGSQRINDKIIEILPYLLEDFEIIHQSGEKNFAAAKEGAKVMIQSSQKKNLEESYHLYPFLKEPELGRALVLSDLVISRAGSGSIFETAAAGKPSILIPLPESAQNHQIKNAYSYKETGACVVIEEANFTAHFFLDRIKHLFSNPDEMTKMSQAAKSFSKPEAGNVIAGYLAEYLSK